MAAEDVPTVGEVLTLLDSAYPERTALGWDAVGLVCGRRDAPARRVLLAVDPVSAVVDEAVETGADLLVVHHPLLLRGVHSLSADTPKGALLHRLIEAGCALYVAHTNADAARDGVNEALASALGLVDLRPLEPAPSAAGATMVTFVPADAVDAVVDAAAAAGAGRHGEYDRCAFTSTGSGTFTGSNSARPAVGSPGRREVVDEVRVEMAVPAGAGPHVVRAVRAAHPYEEPVVHLLVTTGGPADVGIGRVGRLASPMTLEAFAGRVAEVLPATAQGVRVAGDLRAEVSTVALCGGSGDSLFDAVRASRADVFLTADLRHHPASEAREEAEVAGQGRPFLIDVAHWASEWPWLKSCARLVRTLDGVTVTVSERSTDPWNVSIPSTPSVPAP